MGVVFGDVGEKREKKSRGNERGVVDWLSEAEGAVLLGWRDLSDVAICEFFLGG